MKYFLRSHLSLMIISIVQGTFTWGYLWFLGLQKWGHVLYIISVQFLFVLGYLSYRWIEEYKLYKWISSEKSELRLVPELGTSFFSKKLKEKMISNKSVADQKIIESEEALNEGVTFMNQWVHQMKTPISVIHLMINDYDDPLFQDIRREVLRLEDGLKMVLYSSRLSLFEKDYYIEQFAIQTFVNEIIKENKHLFFYFGVYPKIVIEGEDNELFITSDKKWLKFAIEQILSNAIKYSVGGANRVDIKVLKQNNRLLLMIKDYGIGIPEQDRRRVFEPYFTGVNGRKYHESTGMGLYLVREILNKLSHEFTLETTEHEGTSFSIYFSE